MELSDYAQALGAAQRLVPNYNDQREQGLRIQQAQIQNRAAQQQMVAQQDQAKRDADTQSMFQAWSENPTTKGYVDLIARNPARLEQYKAAHDALDADHKESIFNSMAKIYSAGRAGKYDVAKTELQRHIDAAKAAGQAADPMDQAVLDGLNSDDPKERQGAVAMLGGTMALIKPDIAKTIYGDDEKQYTLAPGSKRFDAQGNLIAEAPFSPDRFTLSPGQTRYDGGSEGGDPASSGPVAGRTQFGWTPRARNGGDNSDAAVDGKISGMSRSLGLDPTAPFPPGTTNMQIAQALTLSEGGPGSLADRNNNPGNITDGKGGYRKFPTKEAGLQAAAAQVARNRTRGQNTIQTMVEGLPAGGSGARAVASAPAQAKPGYRLMTPQENQQNGLDPNVRYQMAPDGQITALGGQAKSQGQLKPPPAAAQKSILENHSTVREIDRAIVLVKRRPASVGWGTGALGDWFTQRNDPDGTPIRAAVGKIGGKIIHDVSGAAVTLSEAPRFQPYVPQITDSADTVIKKLEQMKALASADQADLLTAYGPENGYRGVKLPGGQEQARPAPTRTATGPNGQKLGLVGGKWVPLK